VSILFPVMANELRFKSFRLLEQRSCAETFAEGRPSFSRISRITLKTGFYGYFHMAQDAVAQMKPGSAVVDTGPTISMVGSKELIDYSMNKGGVRHESAFGQPHRQRHLRERVRDGSGGHR
jgi:hypothetical protein